MEIVRAAQELLDAEPEDLRDRYDPAGAGTGTPASSASWPPALWKRQDARSSWCRWTTRRGQGQRPQRAGLQPARVHRLLRRHPAPLRRPRHGGGPSVREEDLPTLRRRLNDWAAREGLGAAHTAAQRDLLVVDLDGLTVESVRRLDQLAPYGADTPARSSCSRLSWMGYIRSRRGRHCRLRLRQGNASVYAVWFGMHPEQLPYATGDVVDAALSLSVYDSARGAQLSGRILDLHPAGFGNAPPSRQLWCRRCAAALP